MWILSQSGLFTFGIKILPGWVFRAKLFRSEFFVFTPVVEMLSFSQWANIFGRHRDIPGSYRCRRYHGLGGMKLHHFVVTTLGVCVVSSVKWKRWILSVFTRLCFEPQSDRWLIQSHSGTPWNNTVVAVVTMNKSTETMHVSSCCLGSHQLSSLSIVLQTVPKG